MRLADPPADLLVRTAYARETGDAALLYEGMSLADLAHVIELIETDVIPAPAGADLLPALLAIHPSPPLDFALDPRRGDLFSNREAYLKLLTPAAGWLSAGRARREATTIAYRLAVRTRLLALAVALDTCLAALLDLADAHRATLFPDYTYLQPAQPTTFAHYVLGFAYPLLRDLERLRAAYARANSSPAGSGSVNGSRLPLDRHRLAERLGFDTVIPHTRDAMWQADGPIELAALLTSALVTLDRFAEDLQIFSTAEFGLVALADRHSRTSVIMPQKKNPYSLAYLRGVCGESLGTLAAMAAVAKSPSGQIDNRIFAYGDVPRALDQAVGAVLLMADVLDGLAVDSVTAARRASEQFIGATDLAEIIMLEHGLDYRAAHDLVGSAVRAALDAGEATLSVERLDVVAQTAIGRPLGLDPRALADALDPARIVATRAGLGGAAEESTVAMIADCRAALAEHRAWREQAQARVADAEARLLAQASALRARHEAPAPVPAVAASEPRTLEAILDALPQPPNRRRWRFPPPE